jgi:hypothetical protein
MVKWHQEVKRTAMRAQKSPEDMVPSPTLEPIIIITDLRMLSIAEI